MPKRRRRGLGSPTATHERAERSALNSVERLVRVGERALDHRQCGEAFGAIAQAAQHWGEYTANHVHGRGAGTEHIGAEARPVNNAYHAMRDRFVGACLRR